jgi:hypothetical protein
VSPEGRKNKLNYVTVQGAVPVAFAQLAGGVAEMVAAGIRAFERMQDRYMTHVTQRFRATTEAAELWGSLATKRIITVRVEFPNSQEAVNVSFGYRLLRDGSATLAESETPQHLLAEDGISVSSGSILVKLLLPDGTAFWAGAMVTSMRKVDFLVDYATRRMLVQAFGRITLAFEGEDGGGSGADDDGQQQQQKKGKGKPQQKEQGQRRGRTGADEVADDDDTAARGDNDDDPDETGA